ELGGGERHAARDPAHPDTVAASTGDEADVGVEAKRAFDDRRRELDPARLGAAGLAGRGEARHVGPEPDGLSLRRSSYAGARSANFANRFRNESLTTPVGPFRCLERWSSASPCWSVSSGL